MAFIIYCRDVGIGEKCDFVVRGKSEEEIYEEVRKHAKDVHGMKKLPEDLNRNLTRLVREDKAA